MNLYKNKIKFFILNKYRDANYHGKKFLKDFKQFRQDCKKEIVNTKSVNKLFNKDQTYSDLKRSFETKKYRQKQIEEFYKKFEVNFKLKKKYNKKFKPLSRKETSYSSYIYLGLLILQLRRIDIFQKLNIILKIIDKLSENKKKYKYYVKYIF